MNIKVINASVNSPLSKFAPTYDHGCFGRIYAFNFMGKRIVVKSHSFQKKGSLHEYMRGRNMKTILT
jgi:hypothetical protein